MKILLIDNRISEKCERALLKEGFILLKLPPDPDLGEAVASHPDTLLFYLNGNLITTADYCDVASYVFSDLRQMCPNIKITFTADKRSDRYPNDCVMNGLVVRDKLFCKSNSISSTITDLAEQEKLRIIHTNQGYPACTALTFGNSIITADRGLAETARKHGLTVSLIRQGEISLPPYEYGFIGGASFVCEGKVYFFGDPSLHPDGEIIKKAITDAGYFPVALSDERLSDLGGAVVIV